MDEIGTLPVFICPDCGSSRQRIDNYSKEFHLDGPVVRMVFLRCTGCHIEWTTEYLPSGPGSERALLDAVISGRVGSGL